MSSSAVQIRVGTRLNYDGDIAEVTSLEPAAAGLQVTLAIGSNRQRALRIGLRELLDGGCARIVTDELDEMRTEESAAVVLAELTDHEAQALEAKAGHVREVLTGFRSGSADLPLAGEPRSLFEPRLPLMSRYEAKAAELGVSSRTIRHWVSAYRRGGEAELAASRSGGQETIGPATHVDKRWIEVASEVMVEHRDQSRPNRAMVIKRTEARLAARFGKGAVATPSRATAYRTIARLEQKYPTFRLSTKRNRDIADRPDTAYGRLRPTRPGEYLLLDTTRLDVFALDPVTLKWVQAELTVGMDWYTRCITGIRLTPVSTKSVDVAGVLYQAYRPRPAGKDWPDYAVWPEHGVPRSLLVDSEAVDRGSSGTPSIVPETIVVDHGKVYVSNHVTSVCRHMGISIQPARLRTGRDKGPVERFFRTIREDLLQTLPGYKGPDVFSRGLAPENEAFFYLNQLEEIIRRWIATNYHHSKHESLVDPEVPGLHMSPAAMFEHGIARAGFIEAPSSPDLAYEFLPVAWRKIQHYGVDFGGRRYNGPGLDLYRNATSSHRGKANGRWPIHHNPDDIARVFFRDPQTRTWHPLTWEHAPSMDMPLSEDALEFARKLAASKYKYPDDRLAMADLLERWNLGLGLSLPERRIALRLSREAADLDTAGLIADSPVPPSVTHVLSSMSSVDAGDIPGQSEVLPEADVGDDDLEDELDIRGEGGFYDEALGDA